MEHWLPLYHQRLVTLLDYLPEAGVTLDYQALEARDARLETIADFHEARRQIEGGGDSGGWVYKALAPEALYLAAAEWDSGLAARPGGDYTPFGSEEHTSELQSLMRLSYAVFCLKKKKTTH